ncbi:hypothetical protein [Sphingomonas sp. J344]|uniref:hypothetical protein n=1 Tax=Sphingomonas sp. J344 TaxID=2898434 RepID=UPI0027E31204|nr:hypothetical protein [Sphingomonas sp. J344]
MPGMFAGKSLVLRVTRTRPRIWAVARMMASGDLRRGAFATERGGAMRDFLVDLIEAEAIDKGHHVADGGVTAL